MQPGSCDHTPPHRRRRLSARTLPLVAALALLAMQTAHGQQTCPCTIWPSPASPGSMANDGTPTELGVKFQSDISGYITGVRFYKYSQNTGTHIGNLWSSSGILLATATFGDETASGWQDVTFSNPVAISANTTYIASYHTNAGFYAVTNNALVSTVDNSPLHALASSASEPNGVYQYGANSTFPAQTWQASNYWVDVVFTTNVGPDTTAPTITAKAPADGATNVSASAAITATFSEPVNQTTVSTATMTLRDAGNNPVAATVAYANGVATLTPAGPLSDSTTYTVTVRGGDAGVKDLAGNAMTADVNWQFTTRTPGACPCSIWTMETTPGPAANDSGSLELGMKFQADSNGTVTGLRFYKYPQNTGTHIGSLWTANGILLGTVTFVNESASGWQEAAFPTAVAVNANTTYVVSYHTNSGFYAVSNSGLAGGIDTPPLHALSSAASGGNGLYLYTASSAFPTNSYQSSNYWVDVVFMSDSGPDRTPPTIIMSTPAANASAVPIGTRVSATFSEPLNGATVDTSTVTLKSSGNVVVPASVAYSDGVATLTPSDALSYSTTYTVTVKGGSGGVTDIAGNALANDVMWSFTTAPLPPCPCSIWTLSTPAGADSNDKSPIELGVKFRAETNGYIAGLRFYKHPLNTGTHVGSLWTAGGTLLGSVTYANESASGWQEVGFPNPIAVTANTTYVASYHTNTGHYGSTNSGFVNPIDNAPLHTLASGASGGNGVYQYSSGTVFPTQTYSATNYWVDVVFDTMIRPDTTAPSVTITSPGGGATVEGNVQITAAASDNRAVAGVQFKVDGVNVGAAVTAPPYVTTWNSTTSTSGAHTLSAVATDTSGNSAPAAPVTINVIVPDTTPPGSTITAPANGAVVSGSAVTVSASATDDVGVAGVQFLLDGNSLGSEATAAPYAAAWNTLGSANGWHTLAARSRDAAGNQTTSAAVSVYVWNAPALTIDAVAFGDRTNGSSTVTTSAFSTQSGNELLLAFIATGANNGNGSNTFITNVSGAGLTWVLVQRTNVQKGTAEIWRAFAPSTLSQATVTATLSASMPSSLTVVSFMGADTSGTNGSGAIGAKASANAASGAPTASLTTTRGGSLVFGVGTDWTSNTPHTPGANQTMVHQLLPNKAGNTYWVQRTSGQIASAGATATINDTAPTGDSYNLSIVEVLVGTPDVTSPAVTSVSPANGASGVSIATVITAGFSKAMDAGTINGSTVQLRNSSNALVPAAVMYDASTRTVTLAPSAGLANATVYTATVTTGVRDTAGNTMSAAASWSFTTAAASTSVAAGAGGPILVISNPANPFTTYYAEILRAEGLNAFNVVALPQITPSVLSNYDVAILGEQALTSAQVTMFTNWVQGGGNLIAMRPDKQLASLLGLTDQGATLSNGYILIDQSGAGAGLVQDTIQFHGTADEYLPAPATVVATLYSSASLGTAFPAVTLNVVGNGKAAAFTYDLARSVVYSRQGNPAWAATERDGVAPIRSDDMFFGARNGDLQPDWIDLNKVAIPQADEQQRLLANLIVTMDQNRKPMPRLWYFPRGKKAVVIMTGDDHATGGTLGRFNQYMSLSPAGCSVENWECVRSTSNIYPATPLTDASVAQAIANGFEVSLHVTLDPATQKGCGSDFTAATLTNFYSTQLSQFAANFPSAYPPATHRLHCLIWSDWLTQPQVELSKGMRLDTTYYYWPGSWITNRPGMFTGSGMPMRFAGLDGSMVDVYQAVTQMTDESDQQYPFTIDTLLDNAVGPNGYYGAFAANMHTDAVASAGSDAIVSSALSRGVPVVSARQMLTWLDGRNNSVFGAMSFDGTALSFSIAPASGATGLQLMVPAQFNALNVSGVTLNGASVAYTVQTIKGIAYATFTASAGQYRVSYTR